MVELWSECYLSGAVAEFPFVAIESCWRPSQQNLFSDRAMVHRLELDILTALVRLGWCLGLLSEVSIDHEHAFRLDAEDGDAVLGIPNRRRFLTLLAERLSGLADQQTWGWVLDIEWGGRSMSSPWTSATICDWRLRRHPGGSGSNDVQARSGRTSGRSSCRNSCIPPRCPRRQQGHRCLRSAAWQ